MSVHIFGDLSIEFHALFRAGEYRAALRLVSENVARFPEEGWHISEWRIAAAAACGEQAEMLRVFAEAVEAGYWYPEGRFRDQGYAESFKAYQGQAEFERLVAVCRQRQEAAQGSARAAIQHAPADAPRGDLLLAHRNHSSVPRDLPNWEAARRAGWTLHMAQSSRIMGPETYFWDDRDLALRELLAHLEALDAPRDSLVWAGHMTGGEVALRAAFASGQGRGFLALSPVVPEPEFYRPYLHQARHLRGVIWVGSEDRRCYPGAKAFADLLAGAGIALRFELIPGFTFGYPPGWDQMLAEGLSFVAEGR